MKYLIDFDQTLFDTGAFAAEVERGGRRAERFTPRIFHSYEASDFLFPEVESWLRARARRDLFLVTAITPSLGPEAEAFQREKVERSGLLPLFEDAVFLVGEKGVVAAEIAQQFPPSETIVFIDDRLEQCRSVRAALPAAVCCLMVRDRATIPALSEEWGISVVHDLREVDGVVGVRSAE